MAPWEMKRKVIVTPGGRRGCGGGVDGEADPKVRTEGRCRGRPMPRTTSVTEACLRTEKGRSKNQGEIN
jgi:hypothetical protein